MSKKKKYQVTVDFKDLQDKDKIYRKGDSFPKPGNKKVEEERLEELLSSENKLGKPVIKEI
ncbi:hypothetical protein [Bacillus sp. ISL-57]|uniref:hypothetical protein n=1 Tax=Bacillus sp. ISL-57 TaxID=2819135 RepID=UPI001BE6DE09|nr:hypothetical protein [Bacillus sp. ISL-57]MBT2718328.1 hypothetical protein [Bacillus sp. ISL-57]